MFGRINGVGSLLDFPLLWHSLVLVVGLAAVIPSRSGDLDSHANPSHSYEDAVARAEVRQTADDRVVAPGGRSILLTHGSRTPRVVVLLHGFTASPRQFEGIADSLFASGDNVYVPRLPHHGEQRGDVSA